MDNHDNICVMNEFSLVKNLDDNVQVKSDSSVDMLYLEDVTLIVNNL